MDFNDYAEKAISRYSLTGYNNLARELKINKATLSYFKSGKALPSDDTMIKLAELAGMPKEEALIDLNLWRSKNDPARHEIWLRISKMIGCFIPTLLFFHNYIAEFINLITTNYVYYAYKQPKINLKLSKISY